jgi:hypothetical protein
MLVAAIYLLVAGSGFVLVQLVLRRSMMPRLGLAYLRASLGLSFCLVVIDILAVTFFGVWWIPLPLAMGLGFALPGVMLTMT